MDVKSQLKDAREAIRIKDFRKSTMICRNILSEDADNYLGLVFLGLSIQETSSSEESEKLFKKAIEINPDNLLAWNGLANYYEKVDTTEARLELIKIYTFLIGKEMTEKKLVEYCEKLCSLYKYTNVEEICKVIYQKVEKGNYSDSALTTSRSSLVNILKQSNELSDDILEVYEDILKSLISNNETVTTDYYSQFLMVLYKQQKSDQLLTHVIKMYKMFPDDVVSMNWICKIHNELFVENKASSISETVDIKEVYDKLLVIEPNNAMGLFSKAAKHFEDEEYEDAKEDLRNVVVLRPGLVHGWILLTRVNMLLQYYNDASQSAGFATRLMKSPKCNVDKSLMDEVEMMWLEALSRSAETADWERAVEIYEKLDDQSKELSLPHYTRANIKLGNSVEAKKSLTHMEKSGKSDAALNGILCAQFLRKQGKHKEALDILERKKDATSEWYLELGITYWEMKDFDACLRPLLKAAKGEPNNYYCFYYLGRYYIQMKEYDKARRCYERSYKLCPSYSDAALELSKVYRILKNWDANLAILKNVTKDNINKQNMWAWLQMGLNMMELRRYEEAIYFLHSVARVDEQNLHCWESLADAYLYREAYSSAQKAYEKVLKISEGSRYAALQIATIKKDSGNLQDAISDFETLLRSDGKCVLTLTGLAETCLEKAKQSFREQRLGTTRDYCQYGVEVVTRAVQLRSEISCLWKILGDCCMMTSKLPEKYCCLMIMRAVDEGTHATGDKILEKEDLYQLAARCYCKALTLAQENDLIWHDLASCYLCQAQNQEDKKMANDQLARAQAIIQHCTTSNPRCWQHWNLLGNICLALDPPNYALAQHAFIKAIILDHNCAMAWTNLGVIYFRHNQVVLSNRAFSEAQRADPDYVESWIGQALLAEMLGHDDEAMDLYRHSTSLDFHSQGALGYGHWVCRKLMESPSESTSYAIEALHAIPVACDALTWYTEKYPYECCAWNMLGILRERLGLTSGAAEAFKKALNLSTEKYSDLARINYGRVLTKLGLYKEAVKVCSDTQESSFNSGIWYALALYKDQQFKEASSIYLAIAQYLAQDNSIGDVVACIAIITYILGEPELAKTTIIESFNQRQPTAKVLYAFLALGVLQKDTQLVSLALKQEQETMGDVPRSIEDFITLLSYIHLYQGNHTKAIRKTSELVHLLLNNGSLWLTLSLTLLHALKHAKSQASSAKAARKAATIALKFRSSKSTHKEVSKVLCTISSSALLINDQRTALISAQKAVFCTPDALESWFVLNRSLELYPNKAATLSVTNEIIHSSYRFREIRSNRIF